MNKKKEKCLNVRGVFAIPKDLNYTEEQLNITLDDSVRKFQGMSTHIADLPNEFALALILYDEETNSAETSKVVWMTAEKESAYLPKLNQPVEFYNLQVLEIFSAGEFEVVINIIDGEEVNTGEVIIHNNRQN